MTSCSLVTHL